MKPIKTLNTWMVSLLSCFAITAAHGAAPQPDLVLPLWPGVAPGSENASQVETETPYLDSETTVIRNVTKPTLTVYLPPPERATGTGIVVAPGGGFRFLMMDSEGHDVARWLAEQGIAAFVLKYRLVETPAEDENLWSKIFDEIIEGVSADPQRKTGFEDDSKLAVADGIQAMKLVRERADKWGVASNRIGFMGFSAGAIVTSQVALKAPEQSRPNFAAPIYGAASELPPVTPSTPPFFFAIARDDFPSLLNNTLSLHRKLLEADLHPELHVYRNGGHGFGLRKQGTSSDIWIKDFHNWLSSLGLLGDADTANVDLEIEGSAIRHTVVFRLKHATGSKAEQQFLEAIRQLNQIPEVQQFELMRQVGAKNSFTFGLSMDFADQGAYDRYNEHPLHQRFVRERWLPEVEDFLEIDYAPYP